VAAGRGLGPGAGGAAGRRRRARRAGLVAALPGRDHGPGAPARGGGGQKGGPSPPPDQALGRSKGGFSTKLHLRAERGGKPIAFVLTPGQRQEATQVAALLERGAVARRRGRPRIRPDRVAGDKGYTGRKIRRYLRTRKIGAVIPRLKNEPRRGVRFDRDAYRERNRVERTINRLKQHRSLATRYDKLQDSYHALLTIAAILLWL
jgi:transposase